MKIYSYRQSTYYVSFLLPASILLGIFVWAVYGMWQQGPLLYYKLAIITMPILILSTFKGIHNPTSVQLSESSICFHFFGMKHEYKWNDINYLKINQYPFIGKTLIRIDKPQIFGGRYWVTNQMEGYEELVPLLSKRAESTPNN
ncbi:hypothetical protein [Ammoniphilus sp. 3BR4]|uniref:hypothetical protein n=1 Tax=Ammoniphilus sp. 3BR4 TaxID=3158265 RepID=UPI0034679564